MYGLLPKLYYSCQVRWFETKSKKKLIFAIYENALIVDLKSYKFPVFSIILCCDYVKGLYDTLDMSCHI